MRAAWDRLFQDVDVIAAPSVPLTAAPAGQADITWPDGTVEALSDAYVRLNAPANITGTPALTVPAGHDAAGLPIGLQPVARPLAEPTLLRVAHAHERTAHHPLPRPDPLIHRRAAKTGYPPDFLLADAH